MKKTTQVTMAILLIIGFAPLGAQVTHTDFNPDLIEQMPAEAFGSLGIDIDGDNVDDAKFAYYNYPSFSLWNLGLTQIDTNNPKLELLIDKSVNKSPIGDYYVKVLTAADPVTASADYSSDYPQVGDIYNQNFLGATGKYVGFRLIVGPGSYKYGWMAIELTGSGAMTFTIKELAYNNTAGQAISAGQTNGVGLVHLSPAQIKFNIFPNPVGDYLNATADNKDAAPVMVRIYSFSGNLVREYDQADFPLKINTIGLARGVYFLELSNDEISAKQKFIKL